MTDTTRGGLKGLKYSYLTFLRKSLPTPARGPQFRHLEERRASEWMRQERRGCHTEGKPAKMSEYERRSMPKERQAEVLQMPESRGKL